MDLDVLYEIDVPKPWQGSHPHGQRAAEQRAYRAKSAAKMEAAQRALSRFPRVRRDKRTANHRRAVEKVAKLHRKVHRQRLVNCWSRTPHTAGLLYEMTLAFLAAVRTSHPHTPLLVVSPVRRSDADAIPNALGATLAQLRDAVERATRDTLHGGDDRLALLPGVGLLTPAHLVDGVHPGDEGHALLARAVAESLTGNEFLDTIFGKALD
ncbi:SGNH/GDSL hydrolase family protein [Streptomyces sp. NBC_00120]|uniref:SGNH/GDSL hydrolase family protein n=1 Tax=Streptomyces sp. NBC_00120 TaxID=2975660 RepID=UPI00225A6455|nr:SGNH/GDSL hydrolase family protein [Streptomyces sp. NBC_00120]MCX5323391.1 hypothetical protein [Streptomyces sp. NBC_00120]